MCFTEIKVQTRSLALQPGHKIACACRQAARDAEVASAAACSKALLEKGGMPSAHVLH